MKNFLMIFYSIKNEELLYLRDIDKKNLIKFL